MPCGAAKKKKAKERGRIKREASPRGKGPLGVYLIPLP